MGLNTETIIGLMQLKGVGRKILFKICEQTKDLKEEALLDYLIDAAKTKKISRLPVFSKSDFKDAFAKGEDILERSDRENIAITSFYDKTFPLTLRSIDDPPLIINTKGNLEKLNSIIGVAVIGTREPTPAGVKVAYHVGRRLGSLKYNVVSGLAIGCDTAGHNGCLDGRGFTTAILAHGLHMTYPKQNTSLAERILDSGGVLLSEYFHGTGALANYFVERDRLQSGLSSGTIVIQTGKTGGTMHAVNATIKNKRKLAAIKYKGEELNYSKTEGNEQLIMEGKAFSLTSDNLELFLQSFEQTNGGRTGDAISINPQPELF